MDDMTLPTHIAIIMDGNRRWARNKGIPIKLGHRQGAETLKKIVRHANKIGLKYITVYAFSTENWQRSEEEVNALMLLLQNYLDDFAKEADTENIVIQVIGDRTALSEKLNESIDKTILRTKSNTGTIFNIALNYGGRLEITTSAKNIAKDYKDGKIKLEDIDEGLLSKYMYTKDLPDPDLLIRTSGELRISGFLPWQTVYSELYFIDKLWPDFTADDLDEAIINYNTRKRRRGK